MNKIEETKKKLQELKSKQRAEKWFKRINWIQKHKQGLIFATIFLILGFIIFNQVTYVNTSQYFYIGEIKDIGIRWEGGSTKTAVVWILFNDTNEIDFQRYNYDICKRIELDKGHVGNKVIVTYEKSIIENTLLSIMLI